VRCISPSTAAVQLRALVLMCSRAEKERISTTSGVLLSLLPRQLIALVPASFIKCERDANTAMRPPPSFLPTCISRTRRHVSTDKKHARKLCLQQWHTNERACQFFFLEGCMKRSPWRRGDIRGNAYILRNIFY
jgi:hypothetical protein